MRSFAIDPQLSFCCLQEVATYLPGAAELAGLDHFAHAAALHETLWRSLPKVGEAPC